MNIKSLYISRDSWDDIFCDDEKNKLIWGKLSVYDYDYYLDEPQDSISSMNDICEFFLNPNNSQKSFIKIIKKDDDSFFFIEIPEYEKIKDKLNLSFIEE